ncbi:MAG TPA: hypothetical protein ACFYD3_07725 [Candidatus Hypogeohydataceae bacterium YC41]
MEKLIKGDHILQKKRVSKLKISQGFILLDLGLYLLEDIRTNEDISIPIHAIFSHYFKYGGGS